MVFKGVGLIVVILQVYALTKERDMLRREQNRKSDSSMLLKEKDEIIKAVMAEGWSSELLCLCASEYQILSYHHY